MFYGRTRLNHFVMGMYWYCTYCAYWAQDPSQFTILLFAFSAVVPFFINCNICIKGCKLTGGVLPEDLASHCKFSSFWWNVQVWSFPLVYCAKLPWSMTHQYENMLPYPCKNMGVLGTWVSLQSHWPFVKMKKCPHVCNPLCHHHAGCPELAHSAISPKWTPWSIFTLGMGSPKVHRAPKNHSRITIKSMFFGCGSCFFEQNGNHHTSGFYSRPLRLDHSCFCVHMRCYDELLHLLYMDGFASCLLERCEYSFPTPLDPQVPSDEGRPWTPSSWRSL